MRRALPAEMLEFETKCCIVVKKREPQFNTAKVITACFAVHKSRDVLTLNAQALLCHCAKFAFEYFETSS